MSANSVPLTNLSAALEDTDGSETITRITIAACRRRRACRLIRRSSGGRSRRRRLAADRERTGRGGDQRRSACSGSFNLTLSVTATEMASGDSATTTRPFTVTVSPVADAPAVSVGSGSFTDRKISLSRSRASPPPSSTSTGRRRWRASASSTCRQGRDSSTGRRPHRRGSGGGVWSFTAAELATLRFLPPEHVAGDFDMRLVATSRETANGDEATTTLPFRVTSTPVPDAPAIANGGGVFSGTRTRPSRSPASPRARRSGRVRDARQRPHPRRAGGRALHRRRRQSHRRRSRRRDLELQRR